MSLDTLAAPSRFAIRIAHHFGEIADTLDWEHSRWLALDACLQASGVAPPALTLDQVQHAIAASAQQAALGHNSAATVPVNLDAVCGEHDQHLVRRVERLQHFTEIAATLDWDHSRWQALDVRLQAIGKAPQALTLAEVQAAIAATVQEAAR